MSRQNSPDRSRRTFLTIVAAAGSAALVGLHPILAHAQASPPPAKPQGGELPHLSETDPTAQSLGYKEDASKVDKTKFPTYKPGQMCANCQFFQGTAGQQYGPCQIFAGKAVNAKGWCSAYVAKKPAGT
jgi:hypothetical protein